MPSRPLVHVEGAWSPDVGFSASDCRAYILFRTRNDKPEVEPVEFGDVVTVSISAHRDKFPVARIGEVNPIGFTAGHRTIAGGIVTLFHSESALRHAVRLLFQHYNLVAIWRYPVRPKPDEIPPFDLVLTFVSEMSTAATIILKGVTILDEGFQINVEQPNPYISMSFLAADYEVRYPGDDRWIEIPVPLPLVRAPIRGARLPRNAPSPLLRLPERAPPTLYQRLLNLVSWRQRNATRPELRVRPVSSAPSQPLDLPEGQVQPDLPQVQPLRPGLNATVPVYQSEDLYSILQRSIPEELTRLDDVVPNGQLRSDAVVDPWFQSSVSRQFTAAPTDVPRDVDPVSAHFLSESQRIMESAAAQPPLGSYSVGYIDLSSEGLGLPVAGGYAAAVPEVVHRFYLDEMPLWGGVRELGTGRLYAVDRSWLSDNSQSVATITDVLFPELDEPVG